MPNLSPREQREKYTLYDNKAAFGAEAAEGLRALAQTTGNNRLPDIDR